MKLRDRTACVGAESDERECASTSFLKGTCHRNEANEREQPKKIILKKTNVGYRRTEDAMRTMLEL